MREKIVGLLKGVGGVASVKDKKMLIEELKLYVKTSKGLEEILVTPSWTDKICLWLMPKRVLALQEACKKQRIQISIKAARRFGKLHATECALANLKVVCGRV